MVYKVLIVDDESANLRLLERLFRHDYQVITAASGAEALRALEQHDVALIITDQRMPGMTGLELLQHAAALRPHTVRILLTGYTDVKALVEALNWGQVYKYAAKPWNNDDLRVTVSRALEHYETNKARHELEAANRRLVARLSEMTRGFVRTIADALDAKDDYVHGHARRVSGYATAIGRRMGLDPTALERLSLAALLHDVGKIGTPDSILLKPAPLTEEEYAVMQLHSERGARMLAGIPDLKEVADAVRHHHEHFGGSGYPEGLRGEQIPLAARIILVADAYDALTSPRPFREPRDHDAALDLLRTQSGVQFDPEIVRVFCELEAITQIRRSIANDAYDALLSATPLQVDLRELTFDELVFEIEAKPALALRALRAANTAASSAQTAKLHLACAQLGEARLREVIAQNNASNRYELGTEQLWEHSLRSAAAARLLAERTRIMEQDEAYTLGLLHDVGEMLLHALFPAEMQKMKGRSDGEREQREVEVFGVDHGQVGQWMLESCKLPRALTAAVQTHHDVIGINNPIALLLHVANVIARADSAFKVAELDALGPDRLGMLRLSRIDLATIHAGMAAAVEQRVALLC